MLVQACFQIHHLGLAVRDLLLYWATMVSTAAKACGMQSGGAAHMSAGMPGGGGSCSIVRKYAGRWRSCQMGAITRSRCGVMNGYKFS